MYQSNIKLFHYDITSCIELDSYNRNNFPAIDNNNTGIMGEFKYRIFLHNSVPIKVILYSYLILKKMNECITDS